MPIEKDIITNSDEGKRLPDDTPTPNEASQSEDDEIAKPDLEGTKSQAKETDYLDLEPEGTKAAGNVAAGTEKGARQLDGSNANSLRTK